MTRLELVKMVAQKLGTADPDDITSTTSPDTDYISDIVESVDAAWEEIQIMHEGVWHWRRTQTSFNTTTNREYTFTQIDSTCVGVIPFQHRQQGNSYILIGNNEVDFIPYQNFRGWLDRGTRSSQRPQYFTVRHDGGSKIEFDPTPDAVYAVSLDILTDLQDLTIDGTVPDMPVRFHRTIGFLAATYLAEYDENVRYKLLHKRYTKWLNDLREDQLPKQRFNVLPIGS